METNYIDMFNSKLREYGSQACVLHVRMYVCVRACVRACMHVCMYACMHVCRCACTMYVKKKQNGKK